MEKKQVVRVMTFGGAVEVLPFDVVTWRMAYRRNRPLRRIIKQGHCDDACTEKEV